MAAEGKSIALFSLDPLLGDDWTNGLSAVYAPTSKKGFLPLRYVALYRELKKQIAHFKPDLIHAHYLTNYGFLASIASDSNLVSTAWGSDVFEFPKQSLLNKWVLQLVLKRSQVIISTSEIMALEMRNYTKKPIDIIPFGIDFNLVHKHQAADSAVFKIACFKKLEKVYGIKMLIQAFAAVVKQVPDKKLQLHLYGDGSLRNTLEHLVSDLQLQHLVFFHGWLKPEKIYQALSQTDLCVYLSERESFGVALIEAMAARTPLVTSNLPAFREVAGEETNTLFLKTYTVEGARDQILFALSNPEALAVMTETAYQSVFKRYQLQQNINRQIELYQKLLSKPKN